MSASHPVAPATRIIPMIGHPIAQVKSLGPINAWFLERGVDACLAPVDILPERVAAFLEAVRGWENCVGVSTTLPHKQAAFAACDTLSDRARIARAVNIVRREADGSLHGDMTDGVAFCGEVARKHVKLDGCAFLLVGAGGAGGAVAHAMAEAGASSVAVIDIDEQRRSALIASLREHHDNLTVTGALAPGTHIDVALNATPLGMKPEDAMPFDLDLLPRTALIADAVTRPVMTKWLTAARVRGNAIQTGEEMAVAQLPIQLPFWGFDYRS